jgi:TPP-dependent indolepyruvate ferredoxin oxidoreductase alpha subunit
VEVIHNEVMLMTALEGTPSSEILGLLDLISQRMGEADEAVNDLSTVTVDVY